MVVCLLPIDGCGKHVVYIHRCYFDIVVRCLANVDIVILLILPNFHGSSIQDNNEGIADSVTVDCTVQSVLSTEIHDSREVHEDKHTLWREPGELIACCKSYSDNVLIVGCSSF